jgi:cysteine desulfurase
VIFTSGATESNNLAIKGVAEMYREKGQPHHHLRHRAQGRHRYVQEAREAGRPRDVSAGAEGRTHQAWPELRAAITDKTILITIMTANNEIGVLQPIARDWCDCEREGDPVPHRRGPGGR